MSRTPAAEALDLLQGSDFDEQWEFYEDDDQTVPTDFTAVVAVWRFARDSESTPFLTLTSAGPPLAPPDADGLYFGVGTLRIFIRASTLAALDESIFDRSECSEDGARVFLGLNTLEFTEADFTTRENQGQVRFSPYVEPGT